MKRKLILTIAAFTIVLAVVLSGCGNENAATVLTNGVIYSVEGENWDSKPDEALAVDKDGVIMFVGTTKEAEKFIGENTEVVDLEGKTILPGFIDTHVHAPGKALTELYEIDLFGFFSKEETMESIGNYITENPDLEAYFGTGFNMGMTGGNGEGPNAKWIDEICSDKPVILQSSDLHSMLLNTKAMEISKIDKNTKTAGEGNIHRDQAGNPTGLFTDVNDIEFPSATYSTEQQNAATEKFIDTMNSYGYTSIMSIAPLFGIEYECYKAAEEKGELTLRVNMAQFMDPQNPEGSLNELKTLKQNMESDLIKVDTAKYMLDGVIEGLTAYLKEPYDPAAGLGDNYNSDPTWKEEDLKQSFLAVNEAGFQTHTHSIGDAATTMCLDAIEYAQTTIGEGDYRNVITHLQVVDSSDFHRFGDLGVIAALQPFWHLKEPDWYETVDLAALGEERASKEYPAASLLKNGAVITSSGDYPVSPDNNPFWAIEAGTTRNLYSEDYYGFDIQDSNDPTYALAPKERLTVKDMIEAYTKNGAFQLFREKEVGSLAVGKQADFIVVDNDPFKSELLDIDRIKVLTTVFNGKVVFGEY